MKLKYCVFIVLLFLMSQYSCDTNPYKTGKGLYTYYCSNCHGEKGEGLAALIPPLTDKSYLDANRRQLPCIIRYGLNDTIVVNETTYAQEMAGIEELNDLEITNILNYIQYEWIDNGSYFSIKEVEQALDSCGIAQ